MLFGVLHAREKASKASDKWLSALNVSKKIPKTIPINHYVVKRSGKCGLCS